jgi:hypothetical protein
LLVTAATFRSGARDFALSGFAAFAVSACAVVRAGALLAAGAGVDASCVDGAADAAESSVYSHAEPITGTKPKMINAVAAKTRFMGHLQLLHRPDSNVRSMRKLVNPAAASLSGPAPSRAPDDVVAKVEYAGLLATKETKRAMP